MKLYRDQSSSQQHHHIPTPGADRQAVLICVVSIDVIDGMTDDGLIGVLMIDVLVMS